MFAHDSPAGPDEEGVDEHAVAGTPTCGVHPSANLSPSQFHQAGGDVLLNMQDGDSRQVPGGSIPTSSASLPSPRNPPEKRSNEGTIASAQKSQNALPAALRPPSLRVQTPRSANGQARLYGCSTTTFRLHSTNHHRMRVQCSSSYHRLDISLKVSFYRTTSVSFFVE